MSDQQLYRHSGRFSVSGLIIGLLVTAVVGSALAFIYAYALRYIPFIYINVLLTLGFGFVLGLIAVKFILQFKIRNRTLALVMTFLAVLAAYYCAWVVWMVIHLRSGKVEVSMFELALNPRAVWELMRLFNETGTWSIGRSSTEAVTGLFLAIVWVLEAVMIFGAALLTVAGSLRSPFCEECETWCQERKGIMAVGAHMIDSLRERIMGKDWTVLEEAGLEKQRLSKWCTLDLHVCPSCGQTNTLTLNTLTRRADKEGESKTQTTILIDRLVLSVDETQGLLAACERLQAQPAEDAPAPVSPEVDQAPAAESETA